MSLDSPAAKRPRSLLLTLVIFFLGFPPGYLVQVLFSRWLGAEDYGDFSVALSAASLVATLTLLGLDKAIMKYLPLYERLAEPGRTKGFVAFTFRTVVLFGLALTVVGWLGARLVERYAGVEEHAVLHAMLLVVPMTLAILFVQMLAGQERPVPASFILKIALPSLLIALAAAAHFGEPLTEHSAVWVVGAGHALVAAAMALWLVPGWRRRFAGLPAVRDAGEWMATSRSFLAMALATTVVDQSGILILEAIHDSETDVGIFTAARYTAAFPLFALSAIRMVTIPRLTREAESEDRTAFDRELRRGLRILAATGGLALALWIVWGHAFLALFGLSFESAHLTLVVLGVGCFALLVLGMAPPILMILDERRVIYQSTAALLVASIGLAFLLIPLFGPVGAAFAYTVSIWAVGLFQAWWLERRMGIPYLSLLWSPARHRLGHGRR